MVDPDFSKNTEKQAKEDSQGKTKIVINTNELLSTAATAAVSGVVSAMATKALIGDRKSK